MILLSELYTERYINVILIASLIFINTYKYNLYITLYYYVFVFKILLINNPTHMIIY